MEVLHEKNWTKQVIIRLWAQSDLERGGGLTIFPITLFKDCLSPKTCMISNRNNRISLTLVSPGLGAGISKIVYFPFF